MDDVLHPVFGGNAMDELHYASYALTCCTEGGEQVRRFFIVLKNRSGIIVQWTLLHRFCEIYQNEIFSPVSANAGAKTGYVIQFLNYLREQRIDLTHVTQEIMQAFFDSYAHTVSDKTKDYRRKETVISCIEACTAFVSNLKKKFPEMLVTRHVLWTEKIELQRTASYRKTAKRVITYKPNFRVTGFSNKANPIFRDLPTDILEMLFTLAAQYNPQLLMPMAMGAFAGMRPGECCCVRQEAKAGLRIYRRNGMVNLVEIDLRQVYPLRDDGIAPGAIKKPRLQRVYPMFLHAFMTIYNRQLTYLDHIGYDKQFSPLVINTQGQAMTYATYLATFKHLVSEYLRPMLLADPNPVRQQYGQILQNYSLGPHALRHWFSVRLVLAGENAVTLQHWRGDHSIESASTYLANKSELVQKYREVSDFALTRILAAGEPTELHFDF